MPARGAAAEDGHGRWAELDVTAARERVNHLRLAINGGQDPLTAGDDLRGAPCITDLGDHHVDEHLARQTKTRANGQVSMLKTVVDLACKKLREEGKKGGV